MSQSKSNSEPIVEARKGISLTDVIAGGTMFLLFDVIPAFPSNGYTTLHEHAGYTSWLPGCDYGVELAMIAISGAYLLGRDVFKRNS